MFNPRKHNQWDVYTPLAQKILDTYYVALSQTELGNYFSAIVLNDKDEKLEKRKHALSEEFPEIGFAGKNIVDYLASIFR